MKPRARRILVACMLALLLGGVAPMAGLTGAGGTAFAQVPGLDDLKNKAKCEKINADRKTMKKRIGALNDKIKLAERAQKAADRKDDEKTKAEKDLEKMQRQHKKMEQRMKTLDQQADKADC